MAVPDTGDTQHFERIVAILRKMPKHCLVVVWCNKANICTALLQFLHRCGYTGKAVAQGTVGQLLPTAVQCLVLLPDTANEFYTRWTRDPFLFRSLANGNVEIIKSSVSKLDDDSWAGMYLNRLQFDDVPQYLVSAEQMPVAGGNILFDQDFILVGAKQFRSASGRQGQTAATQHLLDLFNSQGANFTRVIEIGKGQYEPTLLVHIDLYLSLTGYRSKTDGRYTILVGYCELLIASNPGLSQLVSSLNEYLDAVAADLQTQGFSILRNPIPVLKSNKTAVMYLCAYNNCLVEITADTKKVWLPQATYGQQTAAFFSALSAIEQANAAIWNNLHFEVAFIEADFHTIMDDEGALHCITNELHRMP